MGSHDIARTVGKIIDDDEHHSPTKACKHDGNHNDNEEEKHDELEDNVFEGNCFKVELKEKREHKESRDKKKLSSN